MRRARSVLGRIAGRSRGAVPPVDATPHPGERDAAPSGAPTPPRPACLATVNNLYFSATGEVGPCWIQLGGVERWSPERSIRDIWTGPAFEEMRRAHAEGRFPGRCSRCRDDIDQGISPLADVYDNDRALVGLPTALELELSNLCNLECVMCNGDLSSKIRRHREHRPALDVPYDDSFVDQVAELVPTLEQVRFSGGEPTLHPIMYEICERIIELRPDLRIDISTNGSTLTPKVRRLLARAKVQVNISFESLRPERYERIRVGGDHAVLMANIEEFRRLVEPNGGLVTINTNPMRETWDEMADFVRFCDDRDLYLSFNTVVHPPELSLASLPGDGLDDVVRALRAEPFDDATTSAMRWNRDQYRNLCEQVASWAEEACGRATAGDGVPVRLGPART